MKQYSGVVIGVVKDLDDPKKLGRVRLQFPWLSETERSAWASIAAPLAGAQRGAFFMPEKDDEVLVAFEHGDFAHPYVVGFLWNGEDKPPETNLKNRVIKTPGGHQLRFEDAKDAGKVIVQSAQGHRIEIDDTAQTITLKTSAGGQSITLSDATQSVSIRGGNRLLEMKGGQILMS